MAAADKPFIARMRSRINRGDSWLTYDLTQLVPGQGLDDDALDDFEDLLLQADLGAAASEAIVNTLRHEAHIGNIRNSGQLRAALRAALLDMLAPCEKPLEIPAEVRPYVILAVGVNGAGKTTTLGKIGARLSAAGKSVMFAAGDTYRAAAVAQLGTWAERVGAPLISQGQDADPASVIFDACSAAKARGTDVLIADTAGRLHTQGGLMDELRKITRVIRKHDESAPHELMLVVDGTAGHNAVQQARQFHEAVGLTGITLTKLDGTAKGGAIFAVAKQLGLPIRYIGVGEDAEDLGIFEAEAFVDALLDHRTD